MVVKQNFYKVGIAIAKSSPISIREKKMKTYLVTGGCGFIGSHLVDSLINDNQKVIVLDDLSTGKLENLNEKAELVIDSINNVDVVNRIMNTVDGCFHLAAIASVQKSVEDWVETHKVNLTGCINVFNAARHRKVPIVYASSAAAYGHNIDIPLSEESITKPINAYGADKLGCELHAKAASFVHDIPSVGFRFFNVYGPRQDPFSPYSGVISIFQNRALSNQDIVIYGDGEQTRDFVYVADVIRFLRTGMANICLSPMVMNVCTGKKISINQLAKAIVRITGNNVPIRYQDARKGDILTSVGDPKKAMKMLNIKTECSIYEGLEKLINASSHVNETIVLQKELPSASGIAL